MRRATQCCARRVAAGTPSRSTLSVLRTARRPLSDGSGGAVRFAEIKEMPEAVRAVERETDVVDGAPLFVEREATRRVVEALERRGEPGRGRRARRGRGLHVPQLRLHDVRQPELPADVRQVRAVPGRAPAAGRVPADGRARRRQVRGAGADRDAGARAGMAQSASSSRARATSATTATTSCRRRTTRAASRSPPGAGKCSRPLGRRTATTSRPSSARTRPRSAGAARRCARSWAPPSTTRSAATRRRRRWPTSSTV